MPLNSSISTHFRTVYSGLTYTITLIKRGDDQKEGTQRSVKLFECRRSQFTRTGQPIQGEMTADVRTIWHIPAIELTRNGIQYLNSLDKIIEDHDQANSNKPQSAWRYWQPEADVAIATKLMENEIDVACWRIDPPTGG